MEKSKFFDIKEEAKPICGNLKKTDGNSLVMFKCLNHNLKNLLFIMKEMYFSLLENMTMYLMLMQEMESLENCHLMMEVILLKQLSYFAQRKTLVEPILSKLSHSCCKMQNLHPLEELRRKRRSISLNLFAAQ